MRLLLVEDDALLVKNLKAALCADGYVVDTADNGIEGEYLGAVEPYDLVILDLGLPQRPGLDVLKNWRKAGLNMLVLILTARDQWHEKVDGFKAGADDYLGKPFHMEELMQRIKALIRRRHDLHEVEIKGGGLVLDEERQQVRLGDGCDVALTGTEFRLLRYFMLHPGRILSKTRLTEHVYDMGSDRDSNVMEVYVRRLRDKIGKESIRTRRGQGYVFDGGK